MKWPMSLTDFANTNIQIPAAMRMILLESAGRDSVALKTKKKSKGSTKAQAVRVVCNTA